MKPKYRIKEIEIDSKPHWVIEVRTFWFWWRPITGAFEDFNLVNNIIKELENFYKL